MRPFRSIPLRKEKTGANNPDIGISTGTVAPVRSLHIKKQKLFERWICGCLTRAVEISTLNRTANGVSSDRELFTALEGNSPIPAVKPCSL